MRNVHLLIALLFISFGLFAQEAPKNDKDKKAGKAVLFKSEQSVQIDNKTISLDAETGTFALRDNNNKVIAFMGYTAYFQKTDESNTARPLVFAFNGGPLAASVPLHMGILGPKRVQTIDPGMTKGPYKLVNNEFSILDVADLVLIDPIGTGISSLNGDSKFSDFWGVDEDIKSIGSFIEQFLVQKGRINSPKYLLGESYGTFRNAGLMQHLQQKGIAMNGIIMVSAAFNLRTLLYGEGDNLPYIYHLPTFAATAYYHHKAESSATNIESFLTEVREFTEKEYAPALFKGDQLSEEKKVSLAGKLSRYTGLSAQTWLDADLRILSFEFFQLFKKQEGKNIGRYDSRYTGYTYDMLSQNSEFDPSSTELIIPYVTSFKDYFYNTLKADRNLNYLLFASARKGFKWNWMHHGNITWNAQVSISTSHDMRTAMMENPTVKVLILSGYFDLATPFYGVEHTISQLGLPNEIRKNITFKYYEAGHMMYTHGPSREKFKKDVSEFILSTASSNYK